MTDDVLSAAADRLAAPEFGLDFASGLLRTHLVVWLRDVAERHQPWKYPNKPEIRSCAHCWLTVQGTDEPVWPCPDRLSAEAFARVVLGENQP